jgi:SUKH-4 immunity protein
VHQTAATVTLIFCEDESEPESFVNSSVPQFGKSLLLLRQWSLASRTSTVATWQEDVSKLVEDLRNVDPDAFQHEKCYWPSEVRAIQNSVKPGSVEITFDPIPEFHS